MTYICPFVRRYKPFIGNNKFFGFTLIELLTAVAVMAILITVAVPSMRGFILDGRIKSQTDDLAGALNLARSEAIKLGTPVTVCVGNGSTCTGTNWANGWMAWVDRNNNATVDTGEVLRSMALQQTSVTITVTSSDSSNDSLIQFGANGNTNKSDIFTFQICDSARSGETGRKIDVNVTGRARVDKFTCS